MVGCRAVVLAAALVSAQTVMPPFHTSLSLDRLGSAGLNATYGGLTFRAGSGSELLFGEYQSGRIDVLPVTRDAQGHPIAVGQRSPLATVSGPDGGLAYGPGGVLFYTVYPTDEIGQLRTGSVVEDKLVDLSPFIGSSSSVGAIAFVPAGRPGAGRCKIASCNSSEWHDVVLAPDGLGTYGVSSVGPALVLGGGPEGIVYPASSMPMIGSNGVLVCEWNEHLIAVYDCDGNGDPIPATRQVLVENIFGPAGGAVDPVSGDIVFVDNNGGLFVLRGQPSCGQITAYGRGAAGVSGVPTLAVQGCARIGQTLTIQTANGRPGAFGVLGFGYFQGSGSYGNVPLLCSFDAVIGHVLSPAGSWSLGWPVPINSSVGLLHVYLQAGYLDPAAMVGFSATAGVDLYLH